MARPLLGVRGSGSSTVFEDRNEFVNGVALPARKLDQLPHLLYDGAAFGCPGNGDSTAAAKLEQSLVLEQPQRAQHGVGVDSENGCEVSRWWESFTGLRLAICDRTSNLGGDLEVEVGRILFVHLDTNQCTSNTSSMLEWGQA